HGNVLTAKPNDRANVIQRFRLCRDTGSLAWHKVHVIRQPVGISGGPRGPAGILLLAMLVASCGGVGCRRRSGHSGDRRSPGDGRALPVWGAGSFYGGGFSRTPGVAALMDVGRLLFFSPVLSASGGQSCATCHVPTRAFAADNDLPVQPSADGTRAGTRAVPS